MNEWLLAYGSYLLIPFIAALAGWGQLVLLFGERLIANGVSPG